MFIISYINLYIWPTLNCFQNYRQRNIVAPITLPLSEVLKIFPLACNSTKGRQYQDQQANSTTNYHPSQILCCFLFAIILASDPVKFHEIPRYGSIGTDSLNVLFDFILNVHSTIFQLCGTGLPGLNQY